jgi:acyl-CoA synthetase (NDP forming)
VAVLITHDNTLTGDSMNVHEYQAKDLMRKFGIKVLNGAVAKTVDETTPPVTKIYLVVMLNLKEV